VRLSARDVRVDPSEFLQLDLKVHAFLSDVPLHDVSAIDLPGATAKTTLAEVRQTARRRGRRIGGPVTRLLFAVRSLVGRILRWDERESEATRDPPACSYVHRVSAEDARRSLVPVGTREDGFRVIYAFEREAVGELVNATVHAFLCLALVPAAAGARLYWAIYVKPVSRWTRVYMTIIEPFRRHIVYPSLLGGLRRAWLSAHRLHRDADRSDDGHPADVKASVRVGTK
jgi:hypothetical protein